MIALEGGIRTDDYICLLLIAAAGGDLEGVNLHHKSCVSFSIVLSFFSFSIQLGPSSLKPRAKYGSTIVLLVKLFDTNLSVKYICVFCQHLSERHNACNACN